MVLQKCFFILYFVLRRELLALEHLQIYDTFVEQVTKYHYIKKIFIATSIIKHPQPLTIQDNIKKGIREKEEKEEKNEER